MSWAMHDPEGYEEVLFEAIIEEMKATFVIRRFQNQEDDAREQLEVIFGDSAQYGIIKEALIDWAGDKISAAEGDHFAALGDAAEMREGNNG